MGKLRQQHPLYQRITERNLLRQLDLLQDLFEVGRSIDFRINAHMSPPCIRQQPRISSSVPAIIERRGCISLIRPTSLPRPAGSKD
jgi:hypothetical protein